ncbi:ADP-ribosylglycohydrolase family protein [Saccharicrinis sp. 156]|uniref:ADP-ribosylglycohydrolase family protein n=1 Tax=Saccharicrinis sp. 156 TaxID=3417574 RepID=UPI003D32FFA8
MQRDNKLPLNNYVACLLGGAIGDALGAPIEFDSINDIRTKYGSEGIIGYVEHPNACGEFTDDTQMTLFTAEGLLRAYCRASFKGIWGAVNQISHESLLRWLHTQENSCYTPSEDWYPILSNWLIQQNELYKQRAPGNTCLAALRSGVAGTMDKPINNSKGCGTIMRMAPVGLIEPGKTEDNFKMGCELSAITHGHPTGYLSGGFFAAIISELAVGTKLNRAIDAAIGILVRYNKHEETFRAVEAAMDLYKSVVREDLRIEPKLIEQLGEGWVAEEALAMSLFVALIFENDFEQGVLYAVNHSGDSDSIGSIVGNILGLINGSMSIPNRWMYKLSAANLVMEIAEDLYHQSKVSAYGESDFRWVYKYLN